MQGAKPEASTTSRSGSGGETESAPSPCSFWTVRGGGDVALGGSSLREPPPPGDAADGAGTPVALLFLKTRAPPESSLLEFITSTLFPLSGRAGAGGDAMANGTAIIGGGDADVWQVREDGGGACREATGTGVVTGGTSGATMSPPPLVDFAFFKNLASASRLEEVITELQQSE